MNKIEKLTKEISDLQEKIEDLNKQAQDIHNATRIAEEEIEFAKSQIFIESNILSGIGWILAIGKNNTPYIEPDYETDMGKYRDWADKFFALRMSKWNHYTFIAQSASVSVNDHDISIFAIKDKTMSDVIKDFNLKITINKISEKKKEIEKSLKIITDLEKSVKI